MNLDLWFVLARTRFQCKQQNDLTDDLSADDQEPTLSMEKFASLASLLFTLAWDSDFKLDFNSLL